MRISIRLASLFDNPHQRGLISQITEETGIERHTVAALLNNSAKYVSIEKLASLCDYLVRHQICPIESLPGALFGRDAEQFWELLSQQQHQDYFLGVTSSGSSAPDHILASDSRLQAVLVSTTARMDLASQSSLADRPPPALLRAYDYQFHHVRSPLGNSAAYPKSKRWPAAREDAVKRYLARKAQTGSKALIVLGSVSTNPLIDLPVARAFSVEPFVSQDQATSPQRRRVPFLVCSAIWQSDSCLSGRKISQRGADLPPGIHYETAGGTWEHCVCDERNDAAFLVYAHYPHEDLVEIACGGFSSRGTDFLATKLAEIALQTGAPQFESDGMRVGMYLISFELSSEAHSTKPGRKGRRTENAEGTRDFSYRLIPIDSEVLRRRLGKSRRGAGRHSDGA